MDNLYRIVYASRCAIHDNGEERIAAVAALLATGRRHNRRAEVTSVLALHRGRFLQVIEGSRDAAHAAFERIRRDRRHHGIHLLAEESTASRIFPGEALALVGHSAQGRAELDALMQDAGEDLAGIAPADLVKRLERAAAAEDRISLPAAEPGAEAQALDAVWATAVFSADRRLLRANANFDRLFAAAPGKLTGLDHAALIHDDDLSRLDRLWAAMAKGQSLSLDHRALRRDGGEMWLRSAYRPRLDEEGRLRDVVEISTDITEAQVRQALDRGQVAAIDASQAVVHYATDGTVQHANARFLDAMGYALEEVVGQHHALFVDPQATGDGGGSGFWANLAEGCPKSGEYRRVGRDGTAVWLHATYSPIVDMGGNVFKIVEYATVVTEAKLRQADFQWQIAAIHKSHAVITFDMGGIVIDANDAFLDAVGYRRDEVEGRHHRMFVEPAYSHGADYARFWSELGRGRYQAGQFRRLGRDGREVWLQATYNPIFDMDGRPVKVVKYATIVTDEKLRQAEHQGQIAAIDRALCVASFDLAGTILDANDNLLALTGYRLSDLRGRHHALFVPPEEAGSAAYAAFWADLAAGRLRQGEYKRLGRQGREIWFRASYNPIFDMNGRPFKIVKYAADITGEKLQRADFEGQIEAIRKSQCLIAFDMAGTIIDINDKFLAALGYERAALLGQHHSIMVDPAEVGTPDYAAFWALLRAGEFRSGLYRRRAKGGRPVWIQASYNPILDLAGRPVKVIKIATDVTSQVALAEAYEDARRDTQHDAATALPNRARLSAHLTAALAPPCGRVAALYLDLDRFKTVNDMFGHAAGDRALGEVADRLRRCLSNDQLAARVGGDEFVVVAPDLPDDEIGPFCQRLIAAVSQPILHEGVAFTVGLSIGVAVAPMDATTPDALLRCADAALGRSKDGGRGRFSFYAAAMSDRIMAYRTLVDDMRRGIAADEFFLEFQPRFDPRDQCLRSVEALIRWAHPERGRIGPADFIPLAEKSGLIVPLGEWVLRTACRSAMAWPGIGVSVNVSPVQFRDGTLVDVVEAALSAAGLDPHRLEIEITEGALLDDAERARTALDALKRLGVKLAMDDFGTGYSSLSSLRSFPFDVIKIDRTFVADMDGRPGGRAVVQAILQLGHALGLSVTAEGVETQTQLAMLTADACQEVQGFLLARPMPARDIDAWSRSANPAAAAAGFAAPRHDSRGEGAAGPALPGEDLGRPRR